MNENMKSPEWMANLIRGAADEIASGAESIEKPVETSKRFLDFERLVSRWSRYDTKRISVDMNQHNLDYSLDLLVKLTDSIGVFYKKITGNQNADLRHAVESALKMYYIAVDIVAGKTVDHNTRILERIHIDKDIRVCAETIVSVFRNPLTHYMETNIFRDKPVIIPSKTVINGPWMSISNGEVTFGLASRVIPLIVGTNYTLILYSQNILPKSWFSPSSCHELEAKDKCPNCRQRRLCDFCDTNFKNLQMKHVLDKHCRCKNRAR